MYVEDLYGYLDKHIDKRADRVLAQGAFDAGEPDSAVTTLTQEALMDGLIDEGVLDVALGAILEPGDRLLISDWKRMLRHGEFGEIDDVPTT